MGIVFSAVSFARLTSILVYLTILFRYSSTLIPGAARE